MSQPTFLDAIRDSYDTVAADYVKIVRGPETLDPVSRALIDGFAELLLADGAAPGPVADLGCGPGWFTARLAAKGLDAFGVDLSPGMVEQARQAYPHLRFEVGSMTALDLPDASLGGDDEHYSPRQAYGGHPVSYESYLVPADRIVELLTAAGFTVTARLDGVTDTGRTHAIVIAKRRT
jgi:SAM-dependent methyltransferase